MLNMLELLESRFDCSDPIRMRLIQIEQSHKRVVMYEDGRIDARGLIELITSNSKNMLNLFQKLISRTPYDLEDFVAKGNQN